LEFKGDVLGNMAQPRALLKAADEASALMKAAAMLMQPRQQSQEALGKARQAIGRPFLQCAEIELDADHRREAVEMRPAVNTAVDHTHRARRHLVKGSRINATVMIRRLTHGFSRTTSYVTIIAHSRELLTAEDKTAPLQQTGSVHGSIGDQMMKERAECTWVLFNS
jgi:hypothetical protein